MINPFKSFLTHGPLTCELRCERSLEGMNHCKNPSFIPCATLAATKCCDRCSSIQSGDVTSDNKIVQEAQVQACTRCFYG